MTESPLKVVNDNCLVELSVDEYGFSGGDKSKGSENGILVGLPDTLPYLSFHSFAFENSIHNAAKNDILLERYYKPLLGKRVYWSSYTERGSTFKMGNKTYAVLRLTDIIMATDKDAEIATSVEVNGAGSVNLS